MNPATTPCSVIIPTYNGRDILEECLPSIAAELERRGNIDELLIVDNASEDGTGDFIGEHYPRARVLRLEENKAIFSLNPGAAAAAHKYMFFLNNDMMLEPGCMDALLSRFEDGVFAVTGRVLQWDRETVQAGRRRAVYRRGMFWYLPRPGPDAPGPTLYALGGQSIFDRDMFLELGGIDELFSPFYHEDLDLSWRAWQRGRRVLYEPSAVMIHRGAATASRLYTRQQLDEFMQKNMFLFIWKNIHDPRMALEHAAWLLPRAIQALIKKDSTFLRGLRGALSQLPDARIARAAARAAATVSDAQIIKILDGGPE